MNFNNINQSESIKITQKASKIPNSIILSIGDPHFSTEEKIIDQTLESVKEGKTHYVNADGIAELREKIIKQKYNNLYNKEKILITPGVKQAIFYALASLEGKKVCVLEPAWLGYKHLVELLGKEYISVNMFDKTWLEKLSRIDYDILIVNNPNNPSGKILTVKEMNYINNIVLKKKIYLLSDEVYSTYDYTGKFNSFSEYSSDKIIVFDGFSKSYAMTGWRIGYVLTKNRAVMMRMKVLNQHIATCTNSVSQEAALIALESKNNYKSYYKKNVEIVTDCFEALKEYKPDGGLYYFINLEKFGIVNASMFSQKLLEKKGVAVIPGQAYGDEFSSWIRISIAVDNIILKKGINKLKNFIDKYWGEK